MIADIATGNTEIADVCFLFALIAFALAAVVLFARRRIEATATDIPIATVLAYLGLALVALGLLVL